MVLYKENKRLRIGLNPIFQLDIDDEKIDSPAMVKINELREKYGLKIENVSGKQQRTCRQDV